MRMQSRAQFNRRARQLKYRLFEARFCGFAAGGGLTDAKRWVRLHVSYDSRFLYVFKRDVPEDQRYFDRKNHEWVVQIRSGEDLVGIDRILHTFPFSNSARAVSRQLVERFKVTL